jgi:hypothetical protein
MNRRQVMVGGVALALGCAGAGSGPGRRAGEPGTSFPLQGGRDLPRVRWASAPEWFGRAGGLYCPAPRTAGSALLQFADPKWALSNRIRSFRELPSLLDRAQELGADVIYLVDWYEGRPDLAPAEYCWNKGDYRVREDLGGERALREGIEALHQRGGRVLLYLEPFVVEKGSSLGQGIAQRWAIRTAEGYPDDPYPDAWKMCPACAPWAEHLAEVASRVAGYGADGLHLDSYGYQRGWACVEPEHGHAPGDAEVFEAGCKALVERLHQELTRVRPDAVIMTEGPRMAGLFRWATASQDWGIGALTERWIGWAPGQVPVFTSGWNVEDLHQIVALGHRISLGADYWHEGPQRTLREAYEAYVPAGRVPDKKDERFRRFYAEDWFRELHQHRNARLLSGLGAPNVDRAAPRRWDRPESFESHAALEALMREGEALIEAAEAPQRVAPTARVRALVQARRAVAPVIEGSTLTPLPSESPHVAGYRFEGPGGLGISWVNVGTEPVQVELPSGRWREHLQGEDLAGGRLELPPHDLRWFTSTR